MSVSTMKSETVGGNRSKNEGRHSRYRRKMSKNSSVVNGAEEYEDESVVRQINLAAAFHDHLSCTKSSAELCKIDYGTSSALPPDHIYANCSGVEILKNNRITVAGLTTRATELAVENKRLRNLLFLQLELIKEMEEDIFVKDRRIKTYKQESDSLKAHLDRKERMCLLRKNLKLGDCNTKPNVLEVKSELVTTTAITSMTSVNITNTTSPSIANEQKYTVPSLNLVTRYFGRRSKTIPSRALKRRYLGPPKTVPSKPSVPKSITSTISISSGSEAHGNEMVPKPEVQKESKPSRVKTSSLIDIKNLNKRRGKRPKGISRKMDFLTTDKPYFLPDNQIPQRSPVCSETLIDVPSWTLKPVTSFYQMEGTENINDPVFHRRHLKYEQDERRRKRWDIQRLREQKASEKLKYKYCREAGKDSENNLQQKSQSFYPDPRHIQYIEVTDQLPVLAFGHLIPLFQPSEFSITWQFDESQDKEPTHPSPKVVKKTRLSSTGQKVT